MIVLGTCAFGTDILKPPLGDNINSVDIMNLFINDLFVTSNANFLDSAELKWDINTIFWASFNGNLLAGNILIPMESISSVRVKVREYDSIQWTTIYEYKINTVEDFDFARTYYFLKGNKTKYEIAIVPVLNGSESNYITNTVISDFDGCYLCTKTKQYHAFINLSLDVTTNQSRTFISTLGKKKPFMISNGMSNYDTIDMSAAFIPMTDCELDLEYAAKYRKEINDFLTEKQPIILKNYQGQRWLVGVGESIPQSTDGHRDNIIYSINFTEIGDCDSTTDLYINGLSDVNVEGT
jgi:hypothetical protein